MDDPEDRMDWKHDTPPKRQGFLIPFNSGRRRNFDEFAMGEQVQMARAHEPLNTANLEPSQFTLLANNPVHMDTNTESAVPNDLYKDRRGSWQHYIAQRFTLVGVVIAVVSSAVLTSVYRGASKASRFIYTNQQEIRESCTAAVQSSCNAAKRRLITLTARISHPQHFQRRSINSSSPRQNRNPHHPHMTSNRVQWDEELRTRAQLLDCSATPNISESGASKDVSSMMQGIEPSVSEPETFMMTGALGNPFLKGRPSPHYDPFYRRVLPSVGDLDFSIIDHTHRSKHKISSTTPGKIVMNSGWFASTLETITEEKAIDTKYASQSASQSTPCIVEQSPNPVISLLPPSPCEDRYQRMVGSFPETSMSEGYDQIPIENVSTPALSTHNNARILPNLFQQPPQWGQESDDDYSSPDALELVFSDTSGNIATNGDVHDYEFEDEQTSLLTCEQLQLAHDWAELFPDTSRFSKHPNQSDNPEAAKATSCKLTESLNTSPTPITLEESQAEQSTIPLVVASMNKQEEQISPLPAVTPVISLPRPKKPSKNVTFFACPKTGEPVTRTKKYILGESMFFPASSSPCEDNSLSTPESNTSYDSPTMIEQVEAFALSLRQEQCRVAPNLYQPPEDPLSAQTGFEVMSSISRNPEPAGSSDDLAYGYRGAILSETLNGQVDVATDLQRLQGASFSVSDNDCQMRTNSSLSIGLDINPVQSFSNTMPSEEKDESQEKYDVSLPLQEDAPNIEDARRTAGHVTPSPLRNVPVLVPSLGSMNFLAEKDGVEARRDIPATTANLVMEADNSVVRMDQVMPVAQESLLHEADGPFDEIDKSAVEGEVLVDNANGQLIEADKRVSTSDYSAARVKVSKVKAETHGFERDVPNLDVNKSISTKNNQKLIEAKSSRRKSSPRGNKNSSVRKSPANRKVTTKSTPKVVELFTELRLANRRDSDQKSKEEEEEKARLAFQAAENVRKVKEEAEKKNQREREEEEERRKKGIRRIPKEKIIQPLSTEWEAKVETAMNTPDMRTVLVTLPSGTKLTRKDFGTLKVVSGRDPISGWLNDEIILASLQQVVDYGLRAAGHEAGQPPKYHVFNTFFYSNLRDKGAQSVKRWAQRAKIGGKALENVERVFIPVHQGMHWTLLVVSPTARTI